MTRSLVVRLDSDGDVLLAGPAIRAVAAGSEHVALLVSPRGAQAARLLPGVDEVIVWSCPWTGYQPPPVDTAAVLTLVDRVRAARYDVGLVLTSFHQSPLPAALLLRLAGVPRLGANSEDYPGSLLDVRRQPARCHEVERNLSLAGAMGFPLPEGDDAALRLRAAARPVPPRLAGLDSGYVVVHPGASVPARAPSPGQARRIVEALVEAGHRVVVTGADAEAVTRRHLIGCGAVDLIGQTSYSDLAVLLAHADCLVSGNTGPAHLAAAVRTPVVCLFAPVVPAPVWRPWQVPSVLLGDQHEACAGSRARTCPVPGHPCLDGIPTEAIVRAVRLLTGEVAA